MTDDLESEVSDAIPWITAHAAFRRFGKNIVELTALKKAKRVRTKNLNGETHFSVEDLQKLADNGDDEDSPEVTMADLVRASRDLVKQAQDHHEHMFDKYMGAFDKLLKTSSDQIDKQNAHVLALEKQSLEMREAAEKVFNLEHERKMGELREERTRAMQSKALEMLQKTVAPWVASKLGGSIPGVGTPAAGSAESDPRLAQLGQAVIGMVVQMTDEQFESLGKVIPEAEYAVLAMIRQGMKEGAT